MHTVLPLVLVLASSGCSFIDSFDYEFVDGGAGPADGGGAEDGASGGDGGTENDGGAPGDGGGARSCTDPCLADAVLDFDGTSQGAGALGWRYLSDFRAEDGLAYGELAPGDYMGVASWTDGTPPVALVPCVGSAGSGPCAGITDRILMLADAPGDGGDPVLSVTATDAGTWTVEVRHVESIGPVEMLVSRNGRADLVAGPLAVSASEETVSVPVDVLPGDRLFVTARPAAGAPGPVSAAVNVRVSRQLGAPPLEDCLFAARFAAEAPWEDECGGYALSNESVRGAEPTTETTAPAAWLGSARDFQHDALLRVLGARFDYSGDFTVQLWARVDRITHYDTTPYLDWSAADPATTGGITLQLNPGTPDDIVSAEYLFRHATGLSDPSLECGAGAGYCSGTIAAPLPPVGEWHFYRVVRDTAADVVRFCIDGRQVGTGVLPGDVDISNPRSPVLGTLDTISSDPTFDGAVDDVRIFRRALPCEE